MKRIIIVAIMIALTGCHTTPQPEPKRIEPREINGQVVRWGYPSPT